MSAQKRLLSPLKRCVDTVGNKKPKLFPEIKLTNDLFDAFDDPFEFDLEQIEDQVKKRKAQLDLTTWQRCFVDELQRDAKKFDLIVNVRKECKLDQDNSNGTATDVETAKCHLQGIWAHTKLSIGDVISLQAKWDENLMAFKIDGNQGFCIVNADFLLSGTTVVGSLFCRRKAVLQDRFRGIDAGNKVMVVGSLVHELLQKSLAEGLSSLKQVEEAAADLLTSQDTAFMLYSSLLTAEETKMEVLHFVPNIVDFVERYVKAANTDGKPLDPQNFQGTITEIADIEENLWVPQLGLKGKIDVSVRIKRKRQHKFAGELSANQDAIPLELKTGRASFSLEHKGQLILYQMMLKAIGRDINSSGLLLYIREGILREIRAGHNEQRDLIALRNELAHYLTSTIDTQKLNAAKETVEKSGKFFQPFELPEPINHHSACANCAYATICCSFAKTDQSTHLSQQHPLMKLMPQVTSHLKNEDYKYFLNWCTLLALEDQNESKTKFQRALWTDTPAERQSQGRAVTNLQLQHESVKSEEMSFLHTFQVEATNDLDLSLSGFTAGEYLIVSTTKRLAVAAGFLQDLTTSTLTISLERDLRKNYANDTFIVDKHESQTTQVFNYTNLGLLLDDTPRASALREIIVSKNAPTFAKSLPKRVATEGKDILQALNALQRKAVIKALTTESFMLIKGLPGTGKTQTLVALVRLLQLLGKSVIITSHTHSAVDNLLLRLKDFKLKMLRLGNSARVHKELEFCTEKLTLKDCKSERDLAAKYAEFNIVGVTCLGAAHSMFLHRKFDYCIVDEATQVMQPTVLRPLYFCHKFVLVGDPDQLPPLIRSKEALKLGADVSLFQDLDSSEATTTLSLQYRMNRTITKLANELTYAGALKCGAVEIEMATLKPLSKTINQNAEKWLIRTLQAHVDQSVFLLDTMDCAALSYEFASKRHSRTCEAIEQTFAETVAVQQKSNKKRISKYTNYCDAAVIFKIVKTLLSAGYHAERIGVIAPYRAQVELLRKLAGEFHAAYVESDVKLNFNAVEVNTVDQYQGRDKDIIIYSGTKTGTANNVADGEDGTARLREAEILEDKRRLTVAITRAKLKLILVADAECLQRYTPFKALLARIPSYCKFKLENGKLGFEWQQILDELAKIIAK